MKPGAYVQRAYLYARDHNGTPPPWAMKSEVGHWLFDRSYVEADAAANLQTLSVSEAARTLGATRRAIQNWIDAGDIKTLGEREPGEPRRIARDAFIGQLDDLRKRMETPAVVGHRLKHGQPVSLETLERIAGEEAEEEPETTIPPRVPGTVILPPGLDKKLAAARRSSAAALEARLSAAKEDQMQRLREETDNSELTLPGSGGTGEKTNNLKLAAARELQRSRDAFNEYASEVAKRLLADIFDASITRIQGIKLFNRITEERGLPRSIRINVRKRFFGK